MGIGNIGKGMHMRRMLVLVIALSAVLVWSTAGASALHRAVYYDEFYGTAWFPHDQGEILAEYLVEEGYELLGAEELAEWMAARVDDGEPSVVVFAMDSVPYTVCDHWDLEELDWILSAPEPWQKPPTDPPVLLSDDYPLIRQYLEADGKLVWLSDIPFYYVAGPGRANETAGHALSAVVLGVYAAGDEGHWNAGEEVALTDAAEEWGLTETWLSVRPADPDDMDTVLAHDPAGRAAGWVKNYTDNPYTGFVRIFDWGPDIPAGVGLVIPDDLELVRRVAEYFGP